MYTCVCVKLMASLLTHLCRVHTCLFLLILMQRQELHLCPSLLVCSFTKKISQHQITVKPCASVTGNRGFRLCEPCGINERDMH